MQIWDSDRFPRQGPQASGGGVQGHPPLENFLDFSSASKVPFPGFLSRSDRILEILCVHDCLGIRKKNCPNHFPKFNLKNIFLLI